MSGSSSGALLSLKRASSTLPVTSGLVGWYTGDSFAGATWTDLSGAGNHAASSGTISSTTLMLNGYKVLTGTTTSTITWPTTLIPNTFDGDGGPQYIYTMFHVAKYNGPTRKRIFTGLSTQFGGNMVFGFDSNQSGVARHRDYWVTAQTDRHGSAWVLSSDGNHNNPFGSYNGFYRSNRVDRTNANTFSRPYTQLSINGYTAGTQSDWACAEFILFNRALTATEILAVEDYLDTKYVIVQKPKMSKVVFSRLPVSNGLVGWYTGDSFQGTTWVDLSGGANNVTSILGTPENTSTTLNGYKAVSGGTTTKLTWPSTILPSTYTLFHLTKYNGATSRRIFTGEWWMILGFHGGKSGVALLTDWITAETNVHGSNWVLSSIQNNDGVTKAFNNYFGFYRSNKVNRTVRNVPTSQTSGILTINGYLGEESDWACAEVVVYNRALSASEVQGVEEYLSKKYGLNLLPRTALSGSFPSKIQRLLGVSYASVHDLCGVLEKYAPATSVPQTSASSLNINGSDFGVFDYTIQKGNVTYADSAANEVLENPNMTGATLSGGVYSLSGYEIRVDSTFAGSSLNVFNKSVGDWNSGLEAPPHWVSLKYPSAKYLHSYSITTSTNPGGGWPTAWTVQGSNDNASWTTLDTRSGSILSYKVDFTASFTLTEPKGPFLYFRLYITAGTNGYQSIGEWRLFTLAEGENPDLGAAISTGTNAYALSGYTLKQSSMYGASSVPRAFNKVLASSWHSATGVNWAGGAREWISITYPTATRLHRYQLTARPVGDPPEGFPKSFEIQGSNDDITWTTLDSRTNLSWSLAETKEFLITNPLSNNAYTTYRLFVTNSNNAWVVIGEWRVFTARDGQFFTSHKDTRAAFAVVDGDLTIPAGVTMTPPVRKLFTVLYVTGNLTLNGSVSMTARGANHSGTGDSGGYVAPQAIRVAQNVDIPALGGAGAAQFGSQPAFFRAVGRDGSAGSNNGTGGGATGGTSGSTTGDNLFRNAGAQGTSFSGGSGSGGINVNLTLVGDTRGDIEAVANGGAGTMYGGAGNPGADGTPGGTGGTLIIIVKGNVSGSGNVVSNGSAGGSAGTVTEGRGGGGSGGGSVMVLCASGGTQLSLSAAGGPGGTATGTNGRDGGVGGSGSARLFKLLSNTNAVTRPKLWLDLLELSALAHGAALTTWGGATSYAAGTGAAPSIDRTTESVPFVALRGTSNLNGGYLNFGTQTFNIDANGGFTFVGMVRMRQNNGWERIFDFGNGQENQNVFLSRNGSSSTEALFQVRPYNLMSAGIITNNAWQVYAARIQKNAENNTWVISQRNALGAILNGSTIPGEVSFTRTLSNCYVGRSNWANDLYASMDIREMMWWDSALSDADIQNVSQYLTDKFGSSSSFLGQGISRVPRPLPSTRSGLALARIFRQMGLESSVVGAYGLRRLVWSHEGPLVRVRNASNVELDIGVNATTGLLDEASLLAHCGSGDGFVTVWYDQSGKGSSATQTTAAHQPRLVVGGVLQSQSGKPGLVYSGNQFLTFDGTTVVGTNYTVAMLVARGNDSKMAVIGGSTVGGSNNNLAILLEGTTFTHTHQFVAYTGTIPAFTSQAYQHVVIRSSSTTGKNTRLGGSQIASSANTDALASWAGAAFGRRIDGAGTFYFTGTMSDVLLFSVAFSDDTVRLVENSTRSYYGL